MTAAAPLALAIQTHVYALGWMLVHTLWQASLIAAALFLLLEALRNARATTRYAVACAALGLIAATPLVTYTTLIGRESVAALPASFLAGGALTFGIVDTTALIMPFVVLGWCVGVGVASARLLNGLVQVQRIRREASRLPRGGWQEIVDRLGGRLGLRTAVRVVESAATSVPTVIGWMRPVILMPAAAVMGLTPQQLEVVIAHELAHVRRHDYLVNLLQCVMETLLFYHPGVWWISGRIREEREYCCDDLVVAVCGDPIGYATTLTNLEAMRGVQPHLALASTGGSLMKRVIRLVGSPAATRRRAVLWIAPLAGMVALAAVAALAGKAVSGTHRQGNAAAPEPQRASVIVRRSADENGETVQPHVMVVENESAGEKLHVVFDSVDTPDASLEDAPGILDLPELLTGAARVQLEGFAEEAGSDVSVSLVLELVEEATGELHVVVVQSDDAADPSADADSAGFLIHLAPQLSGAAPIHAPFDADGVRPAAYVVFGKLMPLADDESIDDPQTVDVLVDLGFETGAVTLDLAPVAVDGEVSFAPVIVDWQSADDVAIAELHRVREEMHEVHVSEAPRQVELRKADAPVVDRAPTPGATVKKTSRPTRANRSHAPAKKAGTHNKRERWPHRSQRAIPFVYAFQSRAAGHSRRPLHAAGIPRDDEVFRVSLSA